MYKTEAGGVQSRLSSFLYAVYGLMACGLGITAATAYYVSTQPQLYMRLFSSALVMSLVFIAQLAFVFVLTIFITRMSYPVALALFFIYAFSLGVTLSGVFLIYTQASIFQTFLVAAGMFGVMCVYGYVTKSDLSTVGNIGFMALIGLIIAMIVNMFMQSPTIDYVISGAGVLIFTVLTAYDTQKLKQLGQQMLAQGVMIPQIAIVGALTLYLDFVNLFIFLLRFMGTQREK